MTDTRRITDAELEELIALSDGPSVLHWGKLNRALRELRDSRWTAISPENPALVYSVVIGPKKPDFPHLPPWKAKVIMTSNAEAQLSQGWTHFCPQSLPISAPLSAPYGEDETK